MQKQEEEGNFGGRCKGCFLLESIRAIRLCWTLFIIKITLLTLLDFSPFYKANTTGLKSYYRNVYMEMTGIEYFNDGFQALFFFLLLL